MSSPEEDDEVTEALVETIGSQPLLHLQRITTFTADEDEDDDEDDDADDEDEPHLSDSEHSKIRSLLYTSHFLSTWNSRLFEFAAFLFLANIYPQTLLPASIYALARAASAAIGSPWLGPYIDRADRLKVVRMSIVGQRLAVATSCIGLFLMARYETLRRQQLYSALFLAVLSILACIEKLSAVLNTISVERDWVVTVAAGHEERLTMLNAQMRRIDLFCKLFGPLVIALIDSASPRIAIIVTGAMTGLSVLVEYFTIARVYKRIPALQEPKPSATERWANRGSLGSRVKNLLSGTAIYARHPAFLPSFSLALLYLTVLSFSGQMITYLISLGMSPSLVGGLRAISALFELSATWLAPIIMSKIGPVRSGAWFLNWEIICVTIACAFFWLDFSQTLAGVGTVSAVIASRVGLWGFDLSAQIIVQEEVEEHYRGSFSSQEFALQNVFEMIAFASTIVFPDPSQFKYPATISAAAVGLGGALYATFVRSRRGHLVHLWCIEQSSRHKDHHRWWSRLHEREMGNNESSATDDNREYRALAQSTGGDQLLEAS